MTTIMAGMQDSLLILESLKDGWKTHEHLKGTHPQSVALDPQNPNRRYCGTFGDGLWRTDDGGQNWNSNGKDIFSSSEVTSVSVGSLGQKNNGLNRVYLGTEPSVFYVSNDGGESWEKMNAPE